MARQQDFGGVEPLGRRLREGSEDLPVRLDEDEKAAKNRRASEIVQAIERLTAEKKAKTAEINGQMKRLQKELLQVAEAGSTGQRIESVLVADYLTPDGRVARIRLDTGTTIESRAPTEEERQEIIEFDANRRKKS